MIITQTSTAALTLAEILNAAVDDYVREEASHSSPVPTSLAAIQDANITPDFTSPTLQSLICASLVTAAPQIKHLATLISKYATSQETMATLPMIQHLKNGIPTQFVEGMKRSYPNLNIIDDQLVAFKQRVLPEAMYIKTTSERKLIAWYKINSSYYRQSNLKYVNFLNRIQGLEIIEYVTNFSKQKMCDTFVFGHFPWYDTDSSKRLFKTPNSVIRFLISKGFSKATQVRPGQVVIYHTKGETLHFAKVVQVQGDEITVVSKFGASNVYKHLLECVPPEYGDRVTFLDFPSAAQGQ